MTSSISGRPYDRSALVARGFVRPPFNLGDILDTAAAATPEATWIVHGATRMTYGEVDRLAWRMAATLIARGIVPGDRIALLIPNHPAFAIGIWGIWRAGAICVAMHPAYSEPTLAAQLEDCDPVCLITIDEPKLLARAERLAVARGRPLIALPATGSLNCATLADEPVPPRLAAINSIALLQYTGGTTGGVKAAMLTHRSMSENIGQFCAALPGLEPNTETMLAVAPFAHVTGFQLLCQSGYLGARVLLENRFDADHTAQLCLDAGVSFFTCVPTVMEGLNRSAVARRGPWTSLKYVVSGGAPLPSITRKRFETMTGSCLMSGYGLSEASPAVLLGPGEPDAAPESVGPPMPGTQIAISAVDDPARFLPIGETGEVRVAGPQLMDGYWRKPEESAAALAGGMLRTGDLGHVDEGGRVHVSGRLKELIIASGYNVYPQRVEDAILTHDAVADVAVIGVPDDYRGETVRAVIVLKAGETLSLEGLQAWLRPRLSPMEMPKQLELRDSLPKSPAGKTLKIVLRKQAAPSEALR